MLNNEITRTADIGESLTSLSYVDRIIRATFQTDGDDQWNWHRMIDLDAFQTASLPFIGRPQSWQALTNYHAMNNAMGIPEAVAAEVLLTALLTELRLSSERQAETITRQRRTIDHARDAVWERTEADGGCDAGKRDFLEAVGLHDADEIDEMFERDFTVTMSWTVTARSEDHAIEIVNDGAEPYSTEAYAD